MKKTGLIFMIMLLIGNSCVNDIDPIGPSVENSSRIFKATIEKSITRTHVDDKYNILWDDGDCISILGKSQGNNVKYAYSSEEESFTKVDSPAIELDGEVYAVYPYSENVEADNEKITLVFSGTQNYSSNSFGKGANVMVAESNNDMLSFKNVGAYLKVMLYGDNVSVKSVSLKGNGNEPLAGSAYVSFDDNGVPVYEWVNEEECSGIITLSCPEEGVILGASENDATAFWFVVPPQSFAEGFTITVTDTDNETFVKSTVKEVVLERNYLQPMQAVEFLDAPPAGMFWCYAGDAKIEVPMPEGGDINLMNFLPVEINPDDIFTPVNPKDDNFIKRTQITSIVIPEGVTSIGLGAFAYCTNLVNVVLPNGLKTIGFGAFGACASLKTVSIPETVTAIGQFAFAGSGIESVTIPDNVKSYVTLDEYGNITVMEGLRETFYGCTNLTEVNLGSGVEMLGTATFAYCTALENINIPSNVKYIDECVFSECISLKNVVFEEGSQLQYIWNASFEGCKSLESIVLPATLGYPVLTQGSQGFGDNVFRGCNNLKSVYCLSQEPIKFQHGEDVYFYPFPIKEDLRIYVQNELVAESYKEATQWDLLKDNIEVGSPVSSALND